MQIKNVFSKKNSSEISPGFHTQLEVVKNKIDFSKIKNQYFLKQTFSRHEPRLKSPNLQGFLPIPNRQKVRALESCIHDSLQGVVTSRVYTTACQCQNSFR